MMENDETQHESKPLLIVPKEQPGLEKWFMFLLYLFIAGISVVQLVEYSAISSILVNYFDTSYFALSWFGTVFNITYLLLFLPGIWITKLIGMRRSFIVSATGIAIGAWIKCLGTGKDGFWYIMTGQILLSIANVFVLILPIRFAVIWFPKHLVSKVISIGLLSMLIVPSLGIVIVPFIVENSPDAELIGSGLKNLNIAVALISSTIFFLIVLFFKEKPEFKISGLENGTTTVDLVDNNQESPNIENRTRETTREEITNSSTMTGLKDLMKNYNYLMIVLAGAIMFGSNSTFILTLNQLLANNFNDPEKKAGILSLAYKIGATVGVFSTGYILDRTENFKKITVILFLGTNIVYIIFSFFLYLENFWSLLIIIFGFGLFSCGSCMSGLIFAIKVACPTDESSSNGVLAAANQIFSACITSLSTLIITNFGNISDNLFVTLFLFISLILTILTRLS